MAFAHNDTMHTDAQSSNAPHNTTTDADKKTREDGDGDGGGGAAVSATQSPPPPPPSQSPQPQQRTWDVFRIRKAPASLYETDMHSNTLSDHPLTYRASRSELSYRRRRLTERGLYEHAARVEVEAAQRDREGRAGAETREYYWAIACAALGYLLAHSLVYNYYYPADVRFDYAPDRGYLDDVAARRLQLLAVEELVGVSVMESVYDKQKQIRKRRANAVAASLA